MAEIELEWKENGLTELIRAIEAFNRTILKSEKQVEKTDKVVKDHEKTQDSLTKRVRGTAKGMRAFGDAFTFVDSGAGRATRSAGRMIGVFANLSAAGGGAGIAVAGAAAGLFGLAGAAVSASSAVLEAARNSRELAESLAPYQRAGLIPAVSAETQASFDRIDASFDALSVAGSSLATTIATEFAPQIQGMTVGLVAAALAASDLVQSFVDVATFAANAYNSLGPVGKTLIGMHAPIVLIAGEMAGMVSSFADGEAETGSYIERAQQMIGVATTQAAALRNVGTAVDAQKEALDRLNESYALQAQLSDVVFDAQSDLMSAETRAAVELEKRVQALYALSDATEDQGDIEAAVAALRERANRDAFAAFTERVAAERVAFFDEQERQDAASARFRADVAADREAFQSAALAGASSVTSSISSIAQDMTSIVGTESAKAALAMFRISQAAGIANATVSTIVAATKALELGPIAGPIAAGAMYAAGAANVALIAAQPPPQVQRHMGEPLRGARDPLAPDEYSAGGVRGLRQEVPTQGGMLSSAGVNALNASRVQASVQVVPSPWKHLDREAPRLIGSASHTARSVRRQSRAESSPAGRRGW